MKINPQGINSKERKEKQVAQSCHEVVNSRLKSFNVLLSCFHHCQEKREKMMEKHALCFSSVAVITQIRILRNEAHTFDVTYDVRYSS